DSYFVRRVSFEDDMLHHELLVANTRAFIDRALDYIARHAFFARLFDRRGQPGVALGVRPAHFGGDHHFANNFAGGLRLFHRGDGAFGVQPLTSHGRRLADATAAVQQSELFRSAPVPGRSKVRLIHGARFFTTHQENLDVAAPGTGALRGL